MFYLRDKLGFVLMPCVCLCVGGLCHFAYVTVCCLILVFKSDCTTHEIGKTLFYLLV